MTTPPKSPPHLDDPDAPPSEEELREAEALRLALEDAEKPGIEAADFARAVALAHAPRAMSREEHQVIVQKALERMPQAPRVSRLRARVVLAVAAALPLAAAFALYVGAAGRVSRSAPAEPLLAQATARIAHVRSTQPLFREPFPQRGGESARVDRIAAARASDLRDNRFARWGVR